MEILSLNDIYCGYGAGHILKGVSFEIPKGQFVGLIGPNGAGKSTSFRAMTSSLPISRGQVLYKGKNIEGLRTKEFAREVAVIPQSLDIPFSFSVEDFVGLGRYPHIGRFSGMKDVDHNIVKEALVLTEAYQLRERDISQLSGGERQRALIAQAFAQKPELMLLDEPIAHLDIAHKVHLLDLLKKMNQETGLTVVIVLHDLNLAANYCDRLIMLNNGMVFKDGTVDEVITYQNIEEVFETPVLVETNPITKKPYMFLISGDQQGNKKEDS